MFDTLVTPKQVAQWYMATSNKRAASLYEAAEQAGVPQPWRDLVVYMLMARYCEFYEWAKAQLDTEQA